MPILSTEDYRATARDRLAPDVWDFVEGGSGAELTLAANRRAFDDIAVRPRVLVDVTTCTTETKLLGASLRVPLGVAPMAYHRLVHPDGEVGTARGVGAAGGLCVVSIFASQTVEEIAAAATGPLWLQLYWLRRRDVLADLAGRAQAAGYRALVLTVDAPRIGRRLRDLRNGFAIDPSVRAVNLDPDLMTAAHRGRRGESAIATHAVDTFDASVTWADLAWLRGVTDLPLVLKGILTGEDASRAADCGVDAVIVSNHGGRQLVDAAAGRYPVLVDGGVRGGRDAFVALALGASAVLVGRPAMWALAAGGEAGVRGLFDLLHEELTHTMALAGRPNRTDIDRTAVVYPT